MALATIAEIAGIVAAASSVAGTAYAATQSGPSIPSAASSSRQVAQAKANALPIQRALSAAEQQGGQALRAGYTQATLSADQRNQVANQLKNAQNALAQAQANFAKQPNNKAIQANINKYQQQVSALTGKLNAIPEGGGTVYRNKAGKLVPASEAIADFSGYGTADIEGKLAQQMTDVQKNLGAKYGTQFAEEARREQELADPLGTAARAKEYAMIQDEARHPQPISPLAGMLDTGIDAQVKAGAGLDADSQALLDKALARANADRGGNVAAGDVAQSMSTGAEGQARRQAGIDKGQAWLESGSTPADIEFRREQQLISDLGSFATGQTPQSQFQNLSGLGSGAAPFYPGQGLPNQQPNAGAAGPGYASGAYNAQVNASNAQANGWMAGLSGLLRGVGAMAPTQNQSQAG